jgi:pathogenesis-related protein 1
MSCRLSLTICLLWLVGASSGVVAETVEVKSVRLGVLEGAEKERFLAAHNDARKMVEVDPVHWSDELGKYAFESLEQQKEALIDGAKEGWDKRQVALPKHRAETKYGENVAGWAGSGVQTAERAVHLWLSEKAAFEKLNADGSYRVGDEAGKTEPDSQGQERPVIVGHYTAIVWRTTEQIGAAKLEFELADEQGNARRYVAIVCNYSPPGNWRGEKPY